MDASAVFLLGVIVGVFTGGAAVGLAFLRVLRTHFIVPDDEMQLQLARIMEERLAAKAAPKPAALDSEGLFNA